MAFTMVMRVCSLNSISRRDTSSQNSFRKARCRYCNLLIPLISCAKPWGEHWSKRPNMRLATARMRLLSSLKFSLPKAQTLVAISFSSRSSNLSAIHSPATLRNWSDVLFMRASECSTWVTSLAWNVSSLFDRWAVNFSTRARGCSPDLLMATMMVTISSGWKLSSFRRWVVCRSRLLTWTPTSFQTPPKAPPSFRHASTTWSSSHGWRRSAPWLCFSESISFISIQTSSKALAFKKSSLP
mmetsp:Transcript_72518/g.222056  ORF Transcript_72518/g.222056 Transcript_72518/m.222056 type:complete len:241 (+) Transcript_72518:267-989(+)